ncbi:MAG: hypothetical protein LUD72_02630 [Bacteroidales bacterium]|nr:hypothetical protein [Bacteroidales bacterium]
MSNNHINLTETEIKRRIYETALNELDWRTYGNAAAKRIAQSKEERKLAKKSAKKKDKEAWKNHVLLSRKRLRQAQKLGNMAQDTLNRQAEKGEKFVMSPIVADDEYPRGRYARITDNSGKKPSGKSSAVTQAHNFFNGKSEYNKDKSMWESVKRAVTENVIRALAQTETGRRLTESTDRVNKRQVITPIIEMVDRLVEGVRRMVCESYWEMAPDDPERIEYYQNQFNGITLVVESNHSSSNDYDYYYTKSPQVAHCEQVNMFNRGYITLTFPEGWYTNTGQKIPEDKYSNTSPIRTNSSEPKVCWFDRETKGLTFYTGQVDEFLKNGKGKLGKTMVYIAHNDEELEAITRPFIELGKKERHLAEHGMDDLKEFDVRNLIEELQAVIEGEAEGVTNGYDTICETEIELKDGTVINASVSVEFDDPETTYYRSADYYTPAESSGYTTIGIGEPYVEIFDPDGNEYPEEEVEKITANWDWSPLYKLTEVYWG